MGTLPERAAELAAENYKKGLNCAEAIVKTFDQLCNLNLGPSVRLATCFGGGIGQAGDLCGVVSGSIIVLGALTGRSDPPDGDRVRAYAVARGFHDKFVAVNQRTDCDYLRKYDFGLKEQRVNCLNLIVATASLLAEYLLETGLTEA